MEVCMSLIIVAIIYCGFWGLFYYGFGQLAEKIVNYEDPNMKDARIVSSAQEAWYDHDGGMSLEDYTAWYKQKDKFGQMDKVDQLISELDVPLDMLEGDFEYNDYLSILEPANGMDAVRRIDEVIEKLVEIGDVRAVEPLIILAKKRETFRSESAIEALGNFDDKRSIDYLVKSLSDKEKDIRKTAANALDKLGWEPE
jgi:hypothetical protein